MSDADDPHEGELILYQTSEGTVRVEVLYESETFWLNQKKIAELFGVDVRTVSEHLRNIFATKELNESAVLRKFRTTAADGKTYSVNFYNLDAIISVGYRVNSAQATQFRIWATQTLREFVIKGFVLDDERLKLNKRFGKDYFDELLERIREILRQRAAVLPENHRHLRTVQHRLRPQGRNHADVLQDRAKQAALGRHRPDRRRNHRRAGRCHEAYDGFNHLEELRRTARFSRATCRLPRTT